MLRVAIMIPVGRGRAQSYLHNLQSLASQSAPPFDLFVYSDCCEADLVKLTRNVTRRSNAFDNITVLNNRGEISSVPVGCGGARFYLYEEARRNHDIVCSIDDDCELKENWLHKVLEAYEWFPRKHVFTTSVFQGNSLWALGMHVRVEGKFIWPSSNKATDREFQVVDAAIGASSIFCRGALHVSFDRQMFICEDLDMYFNLLKKGIKDCLAIRDAVMIHKPLPRQSKRIPGFRTDEKFRLAAIHLYKKHGLIHGPLWKRFGGRLDLPRRH